MTTWLHNVRLRSADIYDTARGTSLEIGRTNAIVRSGCAILLGALSIWCGQPWWVVAVVPAALGSVLAYLHTREDLLVTWAESRFVLARTIANHLLDVSWKGTANLAGISEALGGFLLVLVTGWPGGPFDAYPERMVLAAVPAVIYVASSWTQVLTDSSIYRTDTDAMNLTVTRGIRAFVPVVGAVVCGVLLSLDAHEGSRYVPLLASTLLLIYPIVRTYEAVLGAADRARKPALYRVRINDAMLVHAQIGAPIHYMRLAAKDRPEDVENLMAYMRNELESCMLNISEPNQPLSVDDLIAGILKFLPEEARGRLRVIDGSDSRPVGNADAPVARGVLSDLCCNALKSYDGAAWPTVTVRVTSRYRASGDSRLRMIEIVVTDDGPGLPVNWTMGESLQRLQLVLRRHGGDLQIQDRPTTGVIATARWCANAPYEQAEL
ncbi:hypothetical protein [Nocardia sp. NPDC056000]|uniref:hypothetical protein n=1 Tax=Nocardia sp. NPDC056000 TaxID=3345674 RepID=UPI0035DBC549